MTERQLLELLLQKVTNIETEQQAMKAEQQRIVEHLSLRLITHDMEINDLGRIK